MKQPHWANFVFAVAILSGLVSTMSCNTTKKTVSNDIEVVEANPKLLFLNYQISKDKQDNVSIKLINKIKADGKLKIKNRETEAKPYDIECLQLDENSKVLQKITIENPLVKHIEFVNDFGELEKKQLVLDSVQFSIKLQLNNHTKFIILQKPNGIELITTKIE